MLGICSEAKLEDMQIEILEKIEFLAESEFKLQAKFADSNNYFPTTVLKKFNADELSLIIDNPSMRKRLSFEERARFYFFAGKYCANIRNYFLVSLGMVAGAITQFGDEYQKEYFLDRILQEGAIASLAITEPKIGSDIANIETSYELRNSSYFINGKKKWITLGGIADFLLVAANGRDGIMFFFVEKDVEGISIRPMEGLLSNKGSYIAEIDFLNVKVPRCHRLGGNEPESRKILSQVMNSGRCIASISAVAMATAAFETTLGYAKERKQFGKRLFEHQLIGKKIADAKTQITTGLLLGKEAFKYEFDNNLNSNSFSAMAKYHNSNLIESITTQCMSIVGANSMSSDFPLERYNREAKGFQFIEGTSEILVQIISSHCLLDRNSTWNVL